jgi:hypothetical protein
MRLLVYMHEATYNTTYDWVNLIRKAQPPPPPPPPSCLMRAGIIHDIVGALHDESRRNACMHVDPTG